MEHADSGALQAAYLLSGLIGLMVYMAITFLLIVILFDEETLAFLVTAVSLLCLCIGILFYLGGSYVLGLTLLITGLSPMPVSIIVKILQIARKYKSKEKLKEELKD